MKLYLVRHGEAGRAASDSARQLTEQGRAETSQQARSARSNITDPVATVIASPLIRARQTAAILQPLWAETVPLLVDHCLLPESSPERVSDFVGALSPDAWPLVLVGHQPLLGKLLGWLIDQPEWAYPVTTSSVTAVQMTAFSRGCGTLLWQLS